MFAFKVLMCSLLVMASIFDMASANRPVCTDIQLSSRGYRLKTEVFDDATSVVAMDVLKRKSRSTCTFGSSYGFHGNTVWVNNGCRADFRVCYKATWVLVICSSEHFRPAMCPIPTGGKRIVALDLYKKISRSACRLNQSFYLRGNAVRVVDGCRGLFKVTFENIPTY
ncbi:hypothetical protein SNE40_002191 [Patella caerulea]|uniref:DUF3011 domain-containing protein n=1 Tax=Patella caerulea TaxID=87958 RepID=A0AAN8KEZ6_PATCE